MFSAGSAGQGIARFIMRLRLPLCLINRHAPRRNRARWDGLSFVSTCSWCDTRIRRDRDGRWMKDWVDTEEG